MAIWDVPLHFTVQADTQSAAADKLNDHLGRVLKGCTLNYTEMGEPVREHVTADECEVLIQ